MDQRLLIITGVSGAGKTLQLELLEERYGNGRILTITTRTRRDAEPEGAYHFVTDSELDAMEVAGDLIWIVPVHGNRYSIQESAIMEALARNSGLGFVTITPDRHAFLAEWCRKKGIVPIHVHLVAPSAEEQIQRLQGRDGGVETARTDSTVNARFEAGAAKAAQGVELHLIVQDSPEAMFARICELLGD